jgi:nitrate reductase NapE
MQTVSDQDPDSRQKGRELRTFLFLTIILAPLLAVMIVGGYGFLVWIYQIIAGPPGPPPG